MCETPSASDLHSSFCSSMIFCVGTACNMQASLQHCDPIGSMKPIILLELRHRTSNRQLIHLLEPSEWNGGGRSFEWHDGMPLSDYRLIDFVCAQVVMETCPTCVNGNGGCLVEIMKHRESFLDEDRMRHLWVQRYHQAHMRNVRQRTSWQL